MSKLYKYLGVISAFVLIAFVKSSPLTSQMAFILAALIIFAVLTSFLQRKKPTFNILFSASPFEVFFLTAVILFMIELTGGISSQLYFLNYFLLFGLPLLSAPVLSLVFAVSIVVFSIPDLMRGETADMAIKIGSILLLLPLSFYFTREIQKKQLETEEIKEKAQKIKDDAEEIEAQDDSIEEREKLDEIINEAEDIKNGS